MADFSSQQHGSRDSADSQLCDVNERASDVLWTQRVALLLCALFCLRVSYLAIVPLELCPDEAYYWDWSRELDWGYYSKPPLIAWIIALATRLGGNGEFAIRLPAAVLGTIGLWPVFALGRTLFSSRVGFWAVVVMAAAPGMAIVSLLMTIDAPFLCAWAFAVWCVWELFGTGATRWRWLPAAVTSTGLGLLSKQTMLGLFPLVLLWLATDAAGRRQLRSAAVWLWIAGSSLSLTPVVWWNWRHDWVTVHHTWEHFGSRPLAPLDRVGRFVEFWTSQFGMVSPVVCGLLIVVTVAALAGWSQTDRRIRYLLCLSAIPMLGVTGLSLTQRVQPNWPASFHLASIVLLAAWACGAWPLGNAIDRWRPAVPVGIAVGAALVLLAYVIPFALPGSSLAGSNFDVTARLRGWRTLGLAVDAKAQELSLPRHALWISATSRGPVSALAYYIPGQPHVYRWNPTGLLESQHEIWDGPSGPVGDEALIVTHGDQPVPADLAIAFADLKPCGQVAVHLGGSRQEVLNVWHGTGCGGWPSRRLSIGPPDATRMAADLRLDSNR